MRPLGVRVLNELIRYSENDFPELVRVFEMKLRPSRILEGKYRIDHGLDLSGIQKIDNLVKFFAAAEGRAINFQFLGTNRRNIIDGLAAGSCAAGDQTSAPRQRRKTLPPKLTANRVEHDVDSPTSR